MMKNSFDQNFVENLRGNGGLRAWRFSEGKRARFQIIAPGWQVNGFQWNHARTIHQRPSDIGVPTGCLQHGMGKVSKQGEG